MGPSGLIEGGRSVGKRGPKTEAGKKAVRRNAVKHGLRAVTPVVEGVEVPEIWNAHVEGIFESLHPEGYLEKELAGRIAELLWRLRRVCVYETDMIQQSINRIPDDYWFRAAAEEYGESLGKPRRELTIEDIDRDIRTRLLPGGGERIARYEAYLHRLYIQTMHELEAIQARRRGERIPLARLDIAVPPGA